MDAAAFTARHREPHSVPPAICVEELHPGDQVEIVAGPLAGVQATVVKRSLAPATWLIRLGDGTPGVLLRLPGRLLRRRTPHRET